ncbi:hypothetical protein ACN6KH_02745 [Enterococcus faecium]
MYKLQTTVQLAFEDFNQPIGLKMNPSNRWIQKAELIPWAELEKDYAKNFRKKRKRRKTLSHDLRSSTDSKGI